MKVFSIVVVQISKKPSVILAGDYELTSFNYFQRGSIQEFMNFFSKTLAERINKPGDRQSVENQDYIGHCHCKNNDLSAVVICDKEYPKRVAFAVLNQVLDDFIQQFPQSQWQPHMTYPKLKDFLNKYQDPHQADNLLRIQKELDETKIIMHKTIESVLERGDKLEDLVAKSDELSAASKTFYKTAQKTNSCCRIM